MGLIRFHDNALPLADFRRLVRGVRALGTERLRDTYQTTFWFPLDARDPETVTEQAAAGLRDLVPRKGVVGVEWWLSRMRTTDVRVDFHLDRDEKLALRTGRVVNPVWSSVFFLNRCRGGLLAVTREPPNEENDALAPDRLDRMDFAKPEPNRFVVFRGSLTHGVLDARNEIPTSRLPGRGPLRLALILNWWDHRPERVPEWNETRLYRGLAVRPASR